MPSTRKRQRTARNCGDGRPTTAKIYTHGIITTVQPVLCENGDAPIPSSSSSVLVKIIRSLGLVYTACLV